LGRGEVHTWLWWGNLRERYHLVETNVDGDNIKMDLQEVGKGGMNWIDLAQDKDMWPTLVNAVIKLRVL